MRRERLLNAFKHPMTEWKVQKAKRAHRKLNPACALCGLKPTFLARSNDVHHKIPVHVRPESACEEKNLITLCRVHHWHVGHIRDWKNFNIRIVSTIGALQRTFRNNAKPGKEA
uniref:Homing endonuclease n=1 Tax=viral metagenome TaxID=1070528 RepID=A0A6M3KT76_9ZZZZ